MHRKSISSLSTFFLLAVCALLPVQTHFVLQESFVQGISWPFNEISVYGIDVLLFIAAILCLFDDRRKIFYRHAFQIVLLFWVMLVFVTAITRSEIHSWVSLVRIGEGVLLAWMIAVHRTSLVKMLTAFLGGMLVASLFGLWQFAAQYVPGSSFLGVQEQHPWVAGVSILISQTARFIRSYGTFPHPNIFSGYLAVAFIGLLFLSLRRAHALGRDRLQSVRHFFERNGWAIFMLLFLSAIAFTFSRNGWLAVGAGTLVLLLVTMREAKKSMLMFWAQATAVAIIFFAVFFQLFFPLAFGRFTLQDAHEQVSIEDRKRATNDFSIIIREHPFIGLGLNRFTNEIVNRIEPDRDWWHIQPVHNTYLLLAAEASPFISIVYVLMLFSLIHIALKKVHRTRHGFPSAALTLALALILFLLGMFDHYLVTIPSGIFLLFFTFGIAFRGLEEPS